MEGLRELINTALAVFAIASLAAYGFQRGTVKSLREDLNDADRRYNVIKEEHEEDKTALSQLQVEFEAIRKVVTGEIHLVAIEQQLDEHHEQTVATLDRIAELLEGLQRGYDE